MRTWLMLLMLALPGVVFAQDAPPASWTDDITLNAFADAFYMVDWNRPERTSGASDVTHRAFDHRSGFNLAFVGVGLRYEEEQVGAVLELYFGQGMEQQQPRAQHGSSGVRVVCSDGHPSL